MDKSWMDPTVGKCSCRYILGCEKFIEFAWNNRVEELSGEIYCPCVRCINLLLWPKNVVEHHIKNRGILRSYVRWTKHGESGQVNTESNEGDDMHAMLQDALGFQNMVANNLTSTNELVAHQDAKPVCHKCPKGPLIFCFPREHRIQWVPQWITYCEEASGLTVSLAWLTDARRLMLSPSSIIGRKKGEMIVGFRYRWSRLHLSSDKWELDRSQPVICTLQPLTLGMNTKDAARKPQDFGSLTDRSGGVVAPESSVRIRNPIGQYTFNKMGNPTIGIALLTIIGAYSGHDQEKGCSRQPIRETRARIKLRGKGSIKERKANQKPDPSDNDDLHVLAKADNQKSLDAAVGMVAKLLIPVADGMNEHKRAQLKELAELNDN
ncbi:hypothetical protein IFM89_018801 [Coptis chinensis]|uniref:Branchpoint-bridging protein n=1 Tax=Coptis chinensis TaxID=261450 RepID=A0A835GX02_9MAGN|nr:hypothetical protein IFM89_018801 [Coptis chinensis]